MLNVRVNNYTPSDCSGHARITGPCGDTMEFWVQVRDGVVEQASFTTDGCAISHACGSMTTCMVEGRPLVEIEELGPEHVINAFPACRKITCTARFFPPTP